MSCYFTSNIILILIYVFLFLGKLLIHETQCNGQLLLFLLKTESICKLFCLWHWALYLRVVATHILFQYIYKYIYIIYTYIYNKYIHIYIYTYIYVHIYRFSWIVSVTVLHININTYIYTYKCWQVQALLVLEPTECSTSLSC